MVGSGVSGTSLAGGEASKEFLTCVRESGVGEILAGLGRRGEALMTRESSWELGKLPGISESVRCRDGDKLLGGTEGTARQADRRREVASELGGGPDLDVGERPFFLLMQEGPGGAFKRRGHQQRR